MIMQGSMSQNFDLGIFLCYHVKYKKMWKRILTSLLHNMEKEQKLTSTK